jgi:hypothetical protein
MQQPDPGFVLFFFLFKGVYMEVKGTTLRNMKLGSDIMFGLYKRYSSCQKAEELETRNNWTQEGN